MIPEGLDRQLVGGGSVEGEEVDDALARAIRERLVQDGSVSLRRGGIDLPESIVDDAEMQDFGDLPLLARVRPRDALPRQRVLHVSVACKGLRDSGTEKQVPGPSLMAKRTLQLPVYLADVLPDFG